MNTKDFPTDGFRLAGLSAPARVLVTVFVLTVGLGYAAAVTNVFAQNELNDGKKGLTSDDLVVHYHGRFVEVAPGETPPSRFLQMIDGDMNEMFESAEDYRVVRQWAVDGASQDTASQDTASQDTADEGTAPTPSSIIKRDCLLCHAADSGEKIADTSPFGPDDDTIDFGLLAEFTKTEKPEAGRTWQQPTSWRSLAMTTHAHLLSVPIFTGILAVLFLLSGTAATMPRIRTLLAAGPLAFFALEVVLWWLARFGGIGYYFALGIGAAGVMFGAFFVTQWFLVLKALWTTRR